MALLYGAYLAKLHEGGRDARDRLEKLEENETGTIRWDAEGSARFIPG